MTLEERLQQAVNTHNEILQQENDLVTQLEAKRAQRQQAMGRVQALDELFREELEIKSQAASQNGHQEQEVPEVLAQLQEQPEEQS